MRFGHFVIKLFIAKCAIKPLNVFIAFDRISSTRTYLFMVSHEIPSNDHWTVSAFLFLKSIFFLFMCQTLRPKLSDFIHILLTGNTVFIIRVILEFAMRTFFKLGYSFFYCGFSFLLLFL